MKDLFAELTKEEKDILIEVPVLMGLYASNHDGRISKEEKKALLKLSHIKTYAGDRALRSFFKEVESHFEIILDKYDTRLPAGIRERRDWIKKRLEPIGTILGKMDMEDRDIWIDNLVKFSKTVTKVHSNISEELLMPMVSDYLHDSHKIKFRNLLTDK